MNRHEVREGRIARCPIGREHHGPWSISWARFCTVAGCGARWDRLPHDEASCSLVNHGGQDGNHAAVRERWINTIPTNTAAPPIHCPRARYSPSKGMARIAVRTGCPTIVGETNDAGRCPRA